MNRMNETQLNNILVIGSIFIYLRPVEVLFCLPQAFFFYAVMGFLDASDIFFPGACYPGRRFYRNVGIQAS
jgi:hypothetical protein